MIDHEFSTYFMFPDSMPRQMYWFEQLARSIQGDEVQLGEFDYLADIRDYLPDEVLEKYKKACDVVFGKIAGIFADGKDIRDSLNGPVCHSGFERLN